MTSLIQTFLASLNDLERAKTLITPDARFIAVRAEQYPDLPLYGTFLGHQGLEDFVVGLRKAFDTQSFHLDHVIENGEIGAAFGRFEHRIRTTEKVFRSHWAVMCEFQDGKISLYRFFEDTAALEDAMGCRTHSKESIA
ncbi:nuclear transport factor 2 family protein [Celeribacter baekdonensis]|uniref:nuclear transport factor 2 family protein n=1 Tax=Celeribacter baekdonensis TaxID=875171 RepID=UPI003A938BB5